MEGTFRTSRKKKEKEKAPQVLGGSNGSNQKQISPLVGPASFCYMPSM